MPVSITFNVDADLLKKCAEILGESVTVDRDGNGDIQIVATKYAINSNTRLIQSIYASLDNLNLREIPPNVKVCNNPGAFADSAAEQAFALILPAIKKIFYHNLRTHKRIFKKEPVQTLKNKTIGILGYGEVGSRIAKIARAFQMNVIAFTRTPKDDLNVDQFAASAARLIAQSDIMVICLPLTNSTRGLVNSDALNMFNGNLIVNISKAEVVNKADIYWYLKRFPEKIYATDVWWNEPAIVDEVPENCIFTPHEGSEVPGDFNEAVLNACRNARKFMDGVELNVIDPSEYYKLQ